jgi:phage terminase large subunit
VVEGIKDVFDGIMCIKSLINEQKLYVNQKCFYTLREFDSYIWDAKNTVKEVPIKINDDCMDAVRYAIYTDGKHGGVSEFGEGVDREANKW